MSIEVISWVFKQTIRPASAKFVLVAIADCADKSGRAYPSEKHLRSVTSLDRKTILSAITQLQAQGFLSDTGERTGRTKQVRVLQITVPKTGSLNGAENGTLGTVGTVPFFLSNGPVFPSKRSQKRDTEPSGTVRNLLKTSKDKWKKRLEGFDPQKRRATWKPFWGAAPDSDGSHFGVPFELLDPWRAARGLRPVVR